MATFVRFVVVLAAVYWLGGLLFYASVVIPTAHDVLGSHRDVGFITRQVTRWINVIGLSALTAFGLHVALVWKSAEGWTRKGLLWTWAVISVAQACLFLLHPALDALLNPDT